MEGEGLVVLSDTTTSALTEKGVRCRGWGCTVRCRDLGTGSRLVVGCMEEVGLSFFSQTPPHQL